jgi:uncharacterized protein (TIGR02452 family)
LESSDQRPILAGIAAETVQILERGFYTSAAGTRIELAAWIERCVAGSAYFEPEALAEIEAAVLAQQTPSGHTSIAVVEESTLAGARALAEQGGFQRVGVLNFASGRRPGGGFLNGAGAQEESLARSSALYPSLLAHPEYYSDHRHLTGHRYSDRMIYSPDCPVLRDDAGNLLDEPYRVDFITSVAPNAGALGKRRRRSGAPLSAILRRRIGKILALACAQGCDALVLGAWGCGVFRNDPVVVAAIFAEFLLEGGPFCGRFRHVRFSVMEREDQRRNYLTFAERLNSFAPTGRNES